MNAKPATTFYSLGEGPAPDLRHVALVPGADVPLLALDLPAQLRGTAREDVARRQLRDRIGAQGDAVEMRPFFAPGSAETWQRALVADAAHLAEWRDQAGPGCRAILPDYLALMAAPGLWCLQGANGAVQARLGLEDGFSADPGLARLMLARALADPDLARPRALLLLGPDVEWAAPLAAAQDIAVIRSAEEAQALGLPRPEPLAHGEIGFDLRTDPQAARAQLRAKVLPWRWPLLFGLVAAGLWGGAQILATQALDRERAARDAATLALVRDHFVPSGPVLDIRTQVTQALTARQDAARDWQGRVSPLALFGRVARMIDAAGATSEEITYDSAGLRAVLRLADFAAAEGLVADLRAAGGLTVEVVDMRVSDGESGVRADIQIRAEK